MKRLYFVVLTCWLLTCQLGLADVRNVLFIVSDDLKASALGVYGNTVCQTPNIDKLAKRGMVFERTYCQGTWCQPSRQSFMHSRYKGKASPNLGEYLRKQGVYSARVGKIYHMKVPGDIIGGTNGQDIESTWDERFNMAGREAHTIGDYACLNLNIFTRDDEGRQSTAMPHRMFVSVREDGDGSAQPDYKAASKVIELLRANKDRRFFIAAGLVRPHYPSVAPGKYFDMYPLDKINMPEQRENDLNDMPPPAIKSNMRSESCGISKYPENQKRMWQAYYATVTYMDEQVGRILNELEKLGLADSTAVIFTSDHGYHLGEHNFWQKGDLHEEVTRVPLVVAGPGMNAKRSRAISELVDIFPTVVELMGFEQPASVQGRSLLPVLKDSDAVVKDAALSFTRAGISLRSDKWAYMHYKAGGEELYNMDKDPGQFTNLASVPEQRAVLKAQHQALKKRLATIGVTEGSAPSP